jgi:predicted RNA-binding protein
MRTTHIVSSSISRTAHCISVSFEFRRPPKSLHFPLKSSSPSKKYQSFEFGGCEKNTNPALSVVDDVDDVAVVGCFVIDGDVVAGAAGNGDVVAGAASNGDVVAVAASNGDVVAVDLLDNTQVFRDILEINKSIFISRQQFHIPQVNKEIDGLLS